MSFGSWGDWGWEKIMSIQVSDIRWINDPLIWLQSIIIHITHYSVNSTAVQLRREHFNILMNIYVQQFNTVLEFTPKKFVRY